jgi:hypothetical protein
MDANSERHGAAGITLRLTRFSPMARRFLQEVSSLGLSPGPGPGAPVRGEDIAKLPESVRRYLIFMGVMGRPRDWSFRLHYEGSLPSAAPPGVGAVLGVAIQHQPRRRARLPPQDERRGPDAHGRPRHLRPRPRAHARAALRRAAPWSTPRARSSTPASWSPTSTTPSCWPRRCCWARPPPGPAWTTTASTCRSPTRAARSPRASPSTAAARPPDFSTEDRYCHDPFTRGAPADPRPLVDAGVGLVVQPGSAAPHPGGGHHGTCRAAISSTSTSLRSPKESRSISRRASDHPIAGIGCPVAGEAMVSEATVEIPRAGRRQPRPGPS